VQLRELGRQRIDPPRSPPLGSPFATARSLRPLRPRHDCAHWGTSSQHGDHLSTVVLSARCDNCFGAAGGPGATGAELVAMRG
jgi:hypothetical protein